MKSNLEPSRMDFYGPLPSRSGIALGIENATPASGASAACSGSGWGAGAGGGTQMPSSRLPDRS